MWSTSQTIEPEKSGVPAQPIPNLNTSPLASGAATKGAVLAPV
ncbi:hypothetical protein [Aphanizomenon flos-aquae]|nr:hypothetical protein [Aphanizomenon flos-aquae]